MTDDIESLLSELRKDIPRMQRNMDMFYREFQARACQILAIQDSPAIDQRLLDMVRDAGIR